MSWPRRRAEVNPLRNAGAPPGARGIFLAQRSSLRTNGDEEESARRASTDAGAAGRQSTCRSDLAVRRRDRARGLVVRHRAPRAPAARASGNGAEHRNRVHEEGPRQRHGSLRRPALARRAGSAGDVREPGLQGAGAADGHQGRLVDRARGRRHRPMLPDEFRDGQPRELSSD